ncbi:hypothetical protein [Pelagibacterium lentulum]|uniref:Uncharacterized protein n=1 Tax=Pelagibacterium lentulum TaxID=2029865 RepID=A0A916W3R8_9HYPH|nr:hypothetical protein [Pelagibacterium lentulum]GGA64975.1 hypothetical protein GCM10011499_39280 [Pelagibacterium lentulum]
MSQTFPVAGRKIYIGPVITAPTGPGAEFTANDFLAPNDPEWTPIGKWQTAGALGGDQQTITTPYINEDWEDVQMGTKNPGVQQHTFGVVEGDPGQVAIYAAAGDKRLRQFLVEFPDAPENGTPSYRLFAAYVKEPAEQGGDANTAGMMQVELVRAKNMVRIAATGDMPPVNTFPPFIYGDAQVGEIVESNNGNWTGADSFAQLWQASADGVGGWAAAGGTNNAANLTVDGDNEGDYLRLRVTATGTGGDTVAYSNVIGPVIPA